MSYIVNEEVINLDFDVFNINDSIKNLVTRFKQISKQGWLMKKTNNPGEFGNNLESLLGKYNNNLPIWDFEGIEIKTKSYNCHDTFITLFNMTPYGDNMFEIERLKGKYGYPDKDIKTSKILHGDVYSSKCNAIGRNYNFRLNVNYDLQRVELLVFNNKNNLIENQVFWPFDILKDKLYQKLKYLALIKVNTKYYNNIKYYKYEKLEVFKLISFEAFLEALKTDKIWVQFKIGVFKSGKRLGQTHDRGTGFQINEKSLNSLYTKIYSKR